ncbi:hypothetical protein C8R43DRAFT_993370 [Mycena crocata]|nr:hypothetical protein C8R43DRAFT_993370 [Mycena crocata]
MSGIRINGVELDHTVHPDILKYHKTHATSSTSLRETRASLRQACAVCMKVGGPDSGLRRCGKCKQASYCSTECQRKDWAGHKAACSRAGEFTLNMAKFSQNLLASDFLNAHLQSCFILAFDLLRRPQLDKPVVARVDIGIEPTDLMDFIGIYTGQRIAKTQGMVQMNAFTVLPAESVQENMMTIWRKLREEVTAAGFATSPLGILVLSKANALVQMIPFFISPDAMQMMEDSPRFKSISSLTGITEVTPVNIDGFMEIMNKHIRADTKDKLSMRSEMTSEDIQTIRDAATGNVLATKPPNWALTAPPPQLAATILKEKVKRESMYKLVFTLAK